MAYITRDCDTCGKPYKADTRNLKRGWGLCCNKSCSAKKRERAKVGYNPEIVKINNIRRDLWNINEDYFQDGYSSRTIFDEDGFPLYEDDGLNYEEGWDAHK